jgi:hypothetical protein
MEDAKRPARFPTNEVRIKQDGSAGQNSTAIDRSLVVSDFRLWVGVC